MADIEDDMDLENSEKIEFDIDDILKPPYSSYQYEDKLSQVSRYIAACSGCIMSEKMLIIDPEGILKRFEEVFISCLKLVNIVSPDILERIKEIESALGLSQNTVRLGIIAKKEYSELLSISQSFKNVLSNFSFSTFSLKINMPDQGMSKMTTSILIEIKVGLERISRLMNSAANAANEWWYNEQDVLVVDELYDPRKISKEPIIHLLKQAANFIENDSTMSENVRTALLGELNETVNELTNTRTPWNKVLSRISQTMLLLGALVTIGSNIDEAFDNSKKAYSCVNKAMSFISSQAFNLTSYQTLNNIERNKTLSFLPEDDMTCEPDKTRINDDDDIL